MVLSRTVLAVASFALTVLADELDDKSKFTFPAEEKLKFYAKDVVEVTYESAYEAADLWLFCQESGEAIIKDKIDNVPSFNGSQNVDINQGISNNACWFNLRPNNVDDSLGINTPHFALTRSERDNVGKTTIGADSDATTSTEAPSSTSETSSSETSSSKTSSGDAAGATNDGAKDGGKKDENNGDEKDDGLSTGAKAGIGVGIALGVIALAAIIVVVIMRRRRKTGAGHGVNPANESDKGSPYPSSAYPNSEYPHSELHGQAAAPTHFNGQQQYYDPHKSPAPSHPQEMATGTDMERRAGAYEMPG